MKQSSQEKSNFTRFIELISLSSILLISLLWIFAANSVHSYFDAFFIESRALITYGGIFEFALERFLPFINLTTFLTILMVACYIVMTTKEQEQEQEQEKSSNWFLNIIAKFISCIVCVFEKCAPIIFIASFLIILVSFSLLVNGQAGTALAEIDKTRFNENQIYPVQLAYKTNAENAPVKSCVKPLATFNKYIFALNQNARAELILQDEVKSIKSHIIPKLINEENKPIKEIMSEICQPDPKYVILSEDFPTFYNVVDFVFGPPDLY